MSPAFSEAGHINHRCLSLQTLITNSLPPSKLSPAAKLSLLRHLKSETRFLLRLPPPPITSNIGYFESIVILLLHPSLRNASRLFDPVADIICTFNSSPAWFLVSHRNPARISWTGALRSRCERALLSARSAPVALKPSSLFIVFARGLPDDAALEIGCGLGAVELDEGWIGVGLWGMKGSRWFRVGIVEDDFEGVGEVGVCGGVSDGEEVDFGNDAFGEFLSGLRPIGDLMNFDTTALVAIVSGISNGAAEGLVRAPEEEMRGRFKGNYKFVIAQVVWCVFEFLCFCCMGYRNFVCLFFRRILL